MPILERKAYIRCESVISRLDCTVAAVPRVLCSREAASAIGALPRGATLHILTYDMMQTSLDSYPGDGRIVILSETKDLHVP